MTPSQQQVADLVAHLMVRYAQDGFTEQELSMFAYAALSSGLNALSQPAEIRPIRNDDGSIIPFIATATLIASFNRWFTTQGFTLQWHPRQLINDDEREYQQLKQGDIAVLLILRDNQAQIEWARQCLEFCKAGVPFADIPALIGTRPAEWRETSFVGKVFAGETIDPKYGRSRAEMAEQRAMRQIMQMRLPTLACQRQTETTSHLTAPETIAATLDADTRRRALRGDDDDDGFSF